MMVLDCCPDPHAAPAGVGEFPYGRCGRTGTCSVCGRGKTIPHTDWCAGVAASLHRANRHPGLRLIVEHGTVARFQQGCNCLRCVHAWLEQTAANAHA